MKRFIAFLVFSALGFALIGQSPQKMSYQCIVRNTSGALVTNHAVGIRISILQGTANGTVVFSETYSPVPQTNVNGLVTVEIGGGTASVGSLSGIDWSAGPYFLKTETDPDGGTNYTITGTSQLLSVPYALYSKTAANGFSGNYNDLTNKPVLFSGSYNDLTNKPVLFSGSYNDLTNKPTLFDGTWNSLTGKPAGFADGIDNVDDADNSITNEIQTLSISGTVLTLSNGGGSVTLPSSGGGDNWGTQAVVTDATLAGNGTTATPLKIAQQSATSGQVLKWDGTAWKPGNDLTGEFTLPYSGTTNTSGAGLSVTNSNTDVLSSAIYGNSSSTTTNRTIGVSGRSASSGGVGIYGSAISTTGINYGVIGFSKSSSGLGVFGQTDATTGKTYGVFGQTGSNEGIGVYGNSLAETGITYGVFGRSVSNTGTGVYGQSYAVSGVNYGVYGKSDSPDGFGVYGNGIKYGVCGNVNSSTGDAYGVYGKANSTSGEPYGVYGISETPHGWGVYGKSSAATGIGIGVQGVTMSSDGTGVLGSNNSSTGTGYGIRGESISPSGTGIYGVAHSTTGTTYGVFGEVKSPSGYSGYFKGGRFFAEGNVGIGIENPVAKLEVNGQVKITGGSPGVGKVLTSDATGLASWQTISTGLSLPYVGEGTSAPSSLFTVNNSGTGASIGGYNFVTTGSSLGVAGSVNSGDGTGVLGSNNSLTGTGCGVSGVNFSSSGRAVYGIAYSTTGTTYGVYGEVKSPSGYSGYFSGGRFFVEGNVGIGSTSIPERLVVAGNIMFPEGVDRFILFPDNTKSIFMGGRPGYESSYAMFFVTDNGSGVGVERLAIKSDKVGVGTVSPTQTLDVNGNARIRSVGSGTYSAPLNITSDGTLTTATSDVRMKENIQTLRNSLDRIMHLRGVSFTWKDNPGAGTRIGFVAQEFEEVIPELVFINGTDGYKGINYAEISAVLVEAIKELKAENDQLKERLDRMEKIMAGDGGK